MTLNQFNSPLQRWVERERGVPIFVFLSVPCFFPGNRDGVCSFGILTHPLRQRRIASGGKSPIPPVLFHTQRGLLISFMACYAPITSISFLMASNAFIHLHSFPRFRLKSRNVVAPNISAVS